MEGLIEGAKKKIWSIATTIAETNPDAEIKMALIAYRDIGDEFVTKTFPLSTDIQEMYAELLKYKAEGGGDWPESVNEALDIAVTKLKWGQSGKDKRIIFLVGDAPPHMDYAQDRKYQDTLKDARQRGIIVNAVQAGNAEDTMRIWRSIAQLGKGEYIPIPQDGGQVSIIVTPYDEEIRRIQILIDETIIPYGLLEVRQKVKTKIEISRSAPAPSAADSSTYILKKSKGRAAMTGSGDLVSDLEEGRVTMDKVKDEDLPEPIAALSREARAGKVKELSAMRARLSSDMAALVEKRDAFLREKTAEEASSGLGDSFDRRVKETLREQIAD
jgi:hypothetical protein